MKIYKGNENDKTILEVTDIEFIHIQRLLEKNKQKVEHKIKDSLSKEMYSKMLEFDI